MLFNSIHFLIFFPVVVFLYFLVPPKGKLLWLLAASYYFYMSWNPKYILLIAAATVATYMGGRLIEKYHARTTLKKYILMSSIAANLGMLFCFKYFGFAVDNVNRILSKAGICLMQAGHDIILPVGISFFTFQALSYTIDVYRGTVKAEKNILKYALFISFFPQLVAGPIERSGNLLNQIQGIPDRKCWDYDRITSGMIYMLWGVFIKLVIADRLAVMVDQVFAAYSSYGMFELFAGAAAFSFQIYGDFAGYSTIAFGAARILGFELTENFAAPYFSKSIKEFWHRWHITLSTWFRDYVYIPMGGSRRGRRRKYLNLMLTFLASGIWHGAGWTFFVWGGYHGAVQILGEMLQPFRVRILHLFRVKTDCASFRGLQTVSTFVLTTAAWVFFRSEGIRDAASYLGRMCTAFNPWVLFDGSLYALGLDRLEMKIAVAGTGLMLLVDGIRYKSNRKIDEILSRQNIWFRWLFVISLLCAVLVYGKYGPEIDAQSFIYFQF